MASAKQRTPPTSSLVLRIKELEEELRMLRQRLSRPSGGKKKPAAFGDLYGIWKGKSDFTYREIKEAEIRLKDDLIDDRGG
jgi:hypothetical protein